MERHSGEMKLNSAYFNKIRIDRRRAPAAGAASGAPARCAGCDAAGTHRAPKGRAQEGEYFWFCLDHVREYNKSYNYFSGMNDAAIQAFQRDAVDRPPADLADGRQRQGAPRRRAPAAAPTSAGRAARRTRSAFSATASRRAVRSRSGERSTTWRLRSLSTLGLDMPATAAEIKARYKLLVKRHHPDANGGDRSLEDRLREIIQAYSYLKSVGFC